MPHKPGNGAIFGIVSEDGASKPDFPVTLLDRTNGNIVNRRYTDLNGGFVFAGLNPETDDYQVIAQDEDNPPFKNAIIRDRIQPVPGYQGATYYGNWRLKSAEFNTIAFYDGTTINDPDPGYGIKIISPYPSNNHPVLLEGVSGSSKAEIQPVLNASITPGDPSIPYSNLNNGKLHVRPRQSSSQPSSKLYGFQQTPAKQSFELVTDFSTFKSADPTEAGVWISGCFYDETSTLLTYSNMYRAFILFYHHESQYMRVYLPSSSKDADSPFYTGGMTNVGSIDMSQYQGVRHFVISVTMGDSVAAYIDGQLVETLSLAGMNANIPYSTNSRYGFPWGIYFAGETSSSGGIYYYYGVDGGVAVTSWYSGALTAEQVYDLYDALMVGTTPQLTGYPKEIFVDRPSVYIRLNEPAGSVMASNLIRQDENFDGDVLGALDFGRPSMVTGQSIAHFNGLSHVIFRSDNFGFQNRYGYSVEFIAKPDRETLDAGDYESLIVGAERYGGIAGIIVRRFEAGTLSVYHQAGGSSERVDFSHVMDTGAMHHYLITVDKIRTEVRLYVDGALVETVVALSTLLDVLDLDDIGYREDVYKAVIGAKIDRYNNATRYYTGILGEISFNQFPLSEAKALQHFEATQVV